MPLKDIVYAVKQLRNNQYSIDQIAKMLNHNRDFIIAVTRGIFD